jgi:hypothetical protein
MDNELETWTEKMMNEQKYRSGIFTDKKSLFTRAASSSLSVFTSKKASHVTLTKGE